MAVDINKVIETTYMAVADENRAVVATTLAQVAYVFDVSPDHIRKDWRQRGMPGSRGHYDLRDVYRWIKSTFRQHAKQAAEVGSDPDGNSFADLEREKLQEEIRKLKNVNAQSESAVVRKDDVLRDLTEWALRARDALNAVPDRCVAIVPAELKPVIRDQVSTTITTLLRQQFQDDVAGATIEESILQLADRIRSGESIYAVETDGPPPPQKKKARRKKAKR